MTRFSVDRAYNEVRKLLQIATVGHPDTEQLLSDIDLLALLHEPTRTRLHGEYAVSVKVGPPMTVWLSISWARVFEPTYAVVFQATEENGRWFWKNAKAEKHLTIAEQRKALGLIEGSTYLRQLKDGSLERYQPHKAG